MYMMYVDESGDVGLNGSPTRYFVLTGVVIHELRWKQTQEELLQFRRDLKLKFGLRLRDEIHASPLISRPGDLARIPKQHRLEILRRYADKLASMPHVSLINVVVDKEAKAQGTDVFELAWKALIQRFENTIAHQNFPGPKNSDDMGLLFPDMSDAKKLNGLLRKMRAHNPVPNAMTNGYRNLLVRHVIEDANFRDSAHSYFIQSVDVAAYLLYQQLSPSAYMKKKSGHNYFGRMTSILCKAATPRDAQGIVRL